MSKRSKKHHYLPREYLRGFVDGQGAFVVYDKRTGNTFTTSPGASFFETDLNTIELPGGQSSDFLEKLYTHIENESWSCLNRIRSASVSDSISIRDKMELFFFLSFLHWRLPGNSDHAERLSRHFFHEGSEMDFVRLTSTDGTAPPAKVVEELQQSPAWKKMAKLVIPFAPFFSGEDWLNSILSWRFALTGDDKSWYIVGDNPIIAEGSHDGNPERCLSDFFFPVSGRVMLMSGSNELQKNRLPPEFTVVLGTAILDRSHRFVACHNDRFLEAIVDLYDQHRRLGNTNRIIPELFEMLREA